MENSRIKSKQLAVFTTIGLLLIATLTPLILGCAKSPSTTDPVFPAVEMALAKGGPVKDDLIRRGFFTMPTMNNSSSIVPGDIKVGEIEKLINSGVYKIDKDGYLVFGPTYTPLP